MLQTPLLLVLLENKNNLYCVIVPYSGVILCCHFNAQMGSIPPPPADYLL